jgi:GMP synthase-like glutamine amidotransferase
MKIATCLQHVAFEGPGAFRQALEVRGYSVRTILVPSEGLPKDPGDVLIVMGGPMSVNDSDPWIAAELNFLQEAIRQGLPVLGICFGSQLLAKAVGGAVAPGPSIEIGMVPVTVTKDGQDDPVFGQGPSMFQVFQWHGEGINLPPGIPVLAASADFPVQAFRVRERCYGLLFHLEMEEAGMQALCRECPKDVQKSGLASETIQAQAIPHLPFLHQFADRLVAHLVA